MIGYIYLLQEREFIKTKENIYKLGKTKQENLKRIQNYPNGTKLNIQLECENCDITEKNLIIIIIKQFYNFYCFISFIINPILNLLI
jgi:hypothetical protein